MSAVRFRPWAPFIPHADYSLLQDLRLFKETLSGSIILRMQTYPHQPYALTEKLLTENTRYTLVEAQQTSLEILQDTVNTSHSLHHNFFYEIRPLIKIAEYIQNEKIADIEFCSQRHEYDGKINFNNNTSKKVEFTRELNRETGENEARRMRLLKQRGRAPAFGKIKATHQKTGAGRKKEIFLENESIAREVKNDSWYQKISDSLISAYQAKQKEKYNGYWLGITFNDWELPRLNEKHHFNTPCAYFEKYITANKQIFERVFVIGDSANFIWDSWHA